MCFLADNDKIKIATKDIVCYKVVSKELTSSVYKYKYTIGEENPMVTIVVGYSKIVRKGYHSYSSLKEAKNNKYSDFCILKCIIPKGTKYMRSMEYKEYVSETIKAVEIL